MAAGFAAFFFSRAHRESMTGSEQCELHDAAVIVGPHESEDLVRLAQSPIGAECQYCPVCRYAREYVERRLAEESGVVPSSGEGANESWRKLQRAVAAVKTTVHRST